ncbi:hypothetical protein SEVIR_3G161300v4 [Setaria viridis]|uniref:RING-type E3 ubiquitin transferase n=1 Tax=Setaria viridis TaxID=4556 RepID=A0A4U6V9W2_SETVI|nr:E3 ubiquitin-protein ligase Arkadia-like [Setaria viridis]TKW26057.1 hypothetical protein SEVIR_3G161300v2 [Setaria viridis]TKW26058.1 hypothetical protein SEVIR_3G161300v2 [Setaria viridis]
MARDGGGSPGAERRRVALRAFLAGGGEASSSAVPAAEVEAVRTSGKGLLRGLRCTSAAASQAIVPAAAADWRGLGCTAAAAQAHAPAAAAVAASEAHEPAAARRSEEWRGRRRRNGRERRKARGAGGGGGGVSGGGGVGGDVWCTPGIPFAAEASSVNCVVAPHQTAGARRRAEAERPRRERPGAPPARRVTMREHMSSSPMNSPPHHGMPFIDADRAPSVRNRHMSGRRHSHARLEEEMMMFRTRILLGRMGMYDQYQDWRLDVDNMTYEELLDLEDQIGYVSTGLREDEITRSLRMVKYSAFNPKHFSAEMDRRCSICQEEFEANEETGKLSCGHSYHVHCIKQWLSRKNACPVCKTTVSKI